MEFKMKLAIGFITYEKTTAKYLPSFLPSLLKALELVPDYKFFCWDNSEAGDENVKYIKTNYPNVEIFSEQKNLGFAKAYNKIIARAIEAGAQYFLALNPDTLLESDAVVEMLKVMEQDKDLGSVSPKVLRWDFSKQSKTNIIDTLGIKLKSGLKFIDLGQGSKDNNQYNHSQILGPSGAAGLFRVSALAKITSPSASSSTRRDWPAPLLIRRGELKERGGQYFDELMFMYKEDCDLAYRLELSGFKAKIAPDAIVYHDRSVKSSKTGFLAFFKGRKGKSRQAKQWSFLNQHIIFIKYWHRQNLWNKIIILARIKGLMLYALLFEQYLLGEYGKLWKIKNNIKKYGL